MDISDETIEQAKSVIDSLPWKNVAKAIEKADFFPYELIANNQGTDEEKKTVVKEFLHEDYAAVLSLLNALGIRRARVTSSCSYCDSDEEQEIEIDTDDWEWTCSSCNSLNPG